MQPQTTPQLFQSEIMLYSFIVGLALLFVTAYGIRKSAVYAAKELDKINCIKNVLDNLKNTSGNKIIIIKLLSGENILIGRLLKMDFECVHISGEITSSLDNQPNEPHSEMVIRYSAIALVSTKNP